MRIRMKKVLFLPIEIVERELDAKLLLALEAVERGYEVYIGDYLQMPKFALRFKGGFYLYKAMVDNKAKSLFEPLYKGGVNIGALDEEGLIFPSLEHYAKSRIGTGSSLKFIKKIFTWGQQQKDFIKNKFDLEDTDVVVTGNPRIDLLRYPYANTYSKKIDELKAKFGDYILINTNFGPGNYLSIFRFSYYEHMKEFGRIKSIEDEEFYKNRVEYYKSLMDHYIVMVNELAKTIFPKNIIIRPHPSENHHTWIEKFKNIQNVHIKFDGAVVPWILASEGLIHTGCTTAVEAFILEKSIIRYNPLSRTDMESDLPNNLGVFTSNIDQLTSAVLNLYNNKNYESREEQKVFLNSWIKNINGKYSYEEIIDAIENEDLGLCLNNSNNDFLTFGQKIRVLARMMRRAVIKNKFLSKVFYTKKRLINQQAKHQRFSGISKRLINQKINKMASLKKKNQSTWNSKMVNVDIYKIEKFNQ